jgi:hypothetical protein
VSAKPRPQWLVPITAGTSPDVRQYNFTAVVTIDDCGRIALGADRPGGPLLVATPLEAAQLAQAMQDASRYAAELWVKARKR